MQQKCKIIDCNIFFLYNFLFRYDIVNESNVPVKVNISFAIKDVISIQEINHAFTLKVF